MEKYFDINEEGCSVRCKLYCTDPRNVKAVVIFCHGFGGHKDNRACARFAEYLLSKHKNFGVVAFDWPCHGEDGKKKLLLSDCGKYLGLVTAYVKKRFDTEDVFINAVSFGGYCTLKYIHENGNPFRKIVLRCPAIPLHEVMVGAIMTEENIALLEKGKDVLVGFDRKIKIDKAFLQDIRENDVTKLSYFDWAEDILILHGTRDEIVPFDNSAKFADDNVIEFIPVENADHRFIDKDLMTAAIQKTIAFYGV